MKGILITVFVVGLAIGEPLAWAEGSLLDDRNGDGVISLVGFGDSLTYGVGDGTQPGQAVEEIPFTDGSLGYLSRIRSIAGIPASNSGEPGEELIDGVNRIPLIARTGNFDIVAILEGTNDGIKRLDSGEYRRLLQKAINVVRASGKEALLMTLPPPCCDRVALAPYTTSYSSVVKSVSFENDLSLVDLERAWRTSCSSPGECDLYNLPEGLHPNSKGYDVFAQTVLATLYGVDVFIDGGAAELESVLGLAPGTVVVKPGV